MLIVKKFEFEMAHCLDGHDRGCNNVHGHSYKLDVGYKPNKIIDSGSSEGMGIDFGDLKKIVNDQIINDFDHSFIYNVDNKKEVRIAKTLHKLGKKINHFPGRTTCENMAGYFLQLLNHKDENFVFIRLYETSGSYVEVWKEDINHEI